MSKWSIQVEQDQTGIRFGSNRTIWFGLDRSRSNSIDLDHSGLDWIDLDRTGSIWIAPASKANLCALDRDLSSDQNVYLLPTAEGTTMVSPNS
jgi:sugar lactone lactonase YvrE